MGVLLEEGIGYELASLAAGASMTGQRFRLDLSAA